MENTILNGTYSSEYIDTLENCTNDYCISDEEYAAIIEEYIFPQTLEWIIVCVYVLTFIVGILGNGLLLVSVGQNRVMHTVTNILITNLAVADLSILAACLPATLIVDVTETWFFGRAMCKLIHFSMVSCT